MPSILKRFMRPKATEYVFPDVGDIKVDEVPEEAEELAEDEPQPEAASQPPKVKEEPSPIDYAEIQAKKMLDEAQRETEEYRAQALRDIEKELEDLRMGARDEGYNQGFTEGLAEARKEGRVEIEKQAAEQGKTVKKFLEDAARERVELIEQSKEELKDLALAIAEKVIRVSLKSSSDIILRMIESATDKHKRCEWAHIYIADCDTKAMALTIPELTSALSHVSDRVRIIPMADDESGTCIIELPDEIIDASVSTQLDAIRGVMSSSRPDKGGA